MKVTVCELPNNWTESVHYWHQLIDHLKTHASDLLLLPEMPFHRWLAAARPADAGQWQEAVASHDRWIERLSELPVPVVLGSRPVLRDGTPHNEGFVWQAPSTYTPAHTKYYLPDEAGFWEATWYRRGNGAFRLIPVNGIRIGFLICSELWFTDHARDYAAAGIHLLVCPRATPLSSRDKWIAGGRAAAVVSGAFCLSANFNGPNAAGFDFGGAGWIIGPEEGDVLGVTSSEQPFLTIEIDPGDAEKAKKTYPRYLVSNQRG